MPDARTAREALTEIRRLSEGIADGSRDAYWTAIEISGPATDGMVEDSTDGAHCERLFLLWAGLTDRAELGREHKRAAAESTMRRVASEWLEVAADETQWRPFMDRWLYEELGFKAAQTPNPEEAAHEQECAEVRADYRVCRCESLDQVPEPWDTRDAKTAVAAYSNPRHMTWVDEKPPQGGVFRCQESGRHWLVTRGRRFTLG